MKDTHQEESTAQPITPELRDKALKMLSSQEDYSWGKVCKLIGLTKSYVTQCDMAEQLGISHSKLRYILYRENIQKKAKESRIAKKNAKSVKYKTYTSNKLNFSISFPSNWKVNSETLETEFETNSKVFEQEIEQESNQIEAKEAYEKYKNILEKLTRRAYENLLNEYRSSVIPLNEFKKNYKTDKKRAYKSFFENCVGIPTDEDIEKTYATRDLSAIKAYEALMEDPETFMVGFEEFKENYIADIEQQREKENRKQKMSQMEEGYFEVSPTNDEEFPTVEVIKLKLTHPMTPLEIYYLDKSNHSETAGISRPSKGTNVDGLHGVKYYLAEKDKNTWNHFINVYLTDNNVGWIISCSCISEAFSKKKPIFANIIDSFRRL